jgi:uncharacterized protein (DUF1800 family)
MALASQLDKLRHLLRRTGFGIVQHDLVRFAGMSIEAVVDTLLTDAAAPPAESALDVWKLINQKNGRLAPQAVAGWWAFQMLTGDTPLREKLALFWHDHFACSAEKVKAGQLMYQHCSLLRENALSDFGTLLEAVAKDPTMLRFLDAQDNVADGPNENFARELLELYTLGIGNYTEQDVQEAARAFTGWSLQRPVEAEQSGADRPLPRFRFRPRLHDDGVKTVLGHTGVLSGEDVLRIALEHPKTAENIATKLWEWFAYQQPEPEIVAALATEFRSSGYSTAAVLRTMFNHPSFYSERAERSLYKQPADFVIGTLRSIGFGDLLATRLDLELQHLASGRSDKKLGKQRLFRPLRFMLDAMSNQGQRLLFPPTVAGWDGGSAWINSATMIERMKFAEVFAPLSDRDDGMPRQPKARGTNGAKGARGSKGRVPGRLLLGDRQFGSAVELVEHAVTMLDVPLDAGKRSLIAQAVDSKTGTGSPQAQVHETLRLIFASPEYQFI